MIGLILICLTCLMMENRGSYGVDVEEETRNCSLYLAPSLIPGAGMGVFAGRSYEDGEEIEKSTVLIVESVIIQSLTMINYVYNSLNPSYAAYLIGSSSMMNHAETPNTERTIVVHRNMEMDVQTVSLRPYSTYHQFQFTVKGGVVTGQEIFGNYGDSSWFTERDIPYKRSDLMDSMRYAPDDLKRIGHCLTDVDVRDSTLDMGGRGLFANRQVEIGSLVSVSPALLVPYHRLVIEGTCSLLVNYCFKEPGNDIALLPIGHNAMANHGGKIDANVEIVWYDIDGSTSQTSMSPEDDNDYMVGRNGHAVYIAFKALRPISLGEEILLDYGSEWENKWYKYLQALEFWLALHGDEDVTFAPQFRHPIHLPHKFFPSKLYKPCAGLDCDRNSLKRHSRSYHHAVLNTKLNTKLTAESTVRSKKESEKRLNFEQQCSAAAHVSTGGRYSIDSICLHSILYAFISIIFMLQL